MRTTIRQVDVARIAPALRNPRRKQSHIDELADSIRTYGLLQPIVLRPRGDDAYEIVAGHRRFAAALLLGWSKVPSIVREAAPDEAYLLTLAENLQREDLSPREESNGLEVLMRERGWSTRQVAEAVHRSASYVSRRLRVFEDPVLAPLVLAGQIGVSVAEELLPLSMTRKVELSARAVALGWDLPRLREAIRGKVLRTATPRRRGLHRRILQLRDDLRDVSPGHITETERRALRLLFQDLAMLARAPAEQMKAVFPPLPVEQRTRRPPPVVLRQV